MDRQGRVRQLYEDGTALVLCTGRCTLECRECGGCHREAEGLIARNPGGAQPGELVLVRSHSGKVFLAALILYILPIAVFFLGYWAGTVWWNAGRTVGCIAFAVSIGVALVYDRHTASKRGSGYTVIKYPQNIDKGDNEFD